VSQGQEPFRRNLTNDDIPFLEEMEGEEAFLLAEEGLDIGPCVPASSKIICIGLNYRRHALESGMTIPALPVVFTKYNNTLVDYGGDVSLGKVGYQFDYEVELGVVMGRRCKNVPAAKALDHVMGYCVANDLSCSLNGEVRQDSNTSDMIFSVAEIIADLSAHMTLEPGDLILTGTPEGVIMGMQEKSWLRPGDVVSVEVEGVGFTCNRMV